MKQNNRSQLARLNMYLSNKDRLVWVYHYWCQVANIQDHQQPPNKMDFVTKWKWKQGEIRQSDFCISLWFITLNHNEISKDSLPTRYTGK